MKETKEPNPKKVKIVEELTELIKKYPNVGIVNLQKMPSAALQKIKQDLKGKAVVKVSKKVLIAFALKKAGLEKLKDYLKGQPALILTDMNPFKLSFFLQKNKSSAPAKAGDIAEDDIVVSAGPTNLQPGPMISTLSKAGIKAKVQEGKLAIINDTVVCKAGEQITEDIVAALNALKIEPMKIGLNLIAMYENGMIYEKDVLDINPESVLNDLVKAHQFAFNLSLNAGYITKDNVGLLLAKAESEAKALADTLKIAEDETEKSKQENPETAQEKKQDPEAKTETNEPNQENNAQ